MRRLVGHGYGRFVALALVAGSVLPGAAEAQLITLRSHADAIVNGEIVTTLVVGQQFKIRMSGTTPTDDVGFGFDVYLSALTNAGGANLVGMATRFLSIQLPQGVTPETDYPTSGFVTVPATLTAGNYYLYRCDTQDHAVGGCSRGPQLTITDPQPSGPALATSPQLWQVGVPVDYTVPAGSGGNPPLSYSVADLPAGLSLNASTRQITGTPSAARDIRTYTVTVTDNDGDTASSPGFVAQVYSTMSKNVALGDIEGAGADGSRQTVEAAGETVRVPIVATGGPTEFSTRVLFSITGTATPMTDYEIVDPVDPAAGASTCDSTSCTGWRRLFANHNNAHIDIRILADSTDDDSEAITVALTGHTGGGTDEVRPTADTTTRTITINEAASFSAGVDDTGTTEGDTVMFTVGFSGAAPQSGTPAMVTWTLGGDAGADDYTAPARASGVLTFTNANWNTAQTVAVAIAEDNLNEGAETLTLTLSDATGADIATAAASTTIAASNPITISLLPPPDVDPDTMGIQVYEDADAVFTVMLSGPSQGGVVLVGPNFSLSTAGGATTADYTDPMMAVTFFPGTTSLPYRLPIAYDGMDETGEMLTLSFTGVVLGTGEAGAVTFGTPNMQTISLVDTQGGVLISPTALTVNERGGTTMTYTAQLRSDPAAQTVTITPSISAGGDAFVSLSGGVLTFTTGNWNTAQPVTVTALSDGNLIDDTVTISHAVSGGGDYAAISSADHVTVRVLDAGAMPAVTIDPTLLTITEAGASGTYTVVLTTDPGASVVVAAGRMAGSNLALGAGSLSSQASVNLTFDSTTWNTAQTVSVGAGHDANTMDAGNDTGTITHTVTGYGSISTADPVIVTIQDDDPGAGSDSAPDFGAASQGDVSYMVGETVNLTLPAASGGNGGLIYTLTPVSGIPAGLAFTAATRVLSGTPTTATGAVALTYTVADSDANTNATDSAALIFEVTITAAVAGITITPVALTVDDGATGEYQVRLTTAPSGGPAIITPSGNNAAVMVSAALTFSATDFGIPQTVTVTSAGDTDFNNDSATISHTVTGYDEFTDTAPTVAVTVIEPAPIIAQRPGESGVIDTSNPLQTPRGQSTPYEVVLSVRPTGTGTVTITLSTHETIDLSLTEPQLSPPGASGGLNTNEAPPLAVTQTHTIMLAFTNANWDTAQTVWITPGADATQGDYVIMHTVNAPMGSNYNGVTIPDTPFRVTPPPADVDSAGLDDVNRMILPEVARALAGRQTEAIAKRVRQAGQSGGGGAAGSFNFGGQSTLSGMAARHARTLADDDLDMKRILGDTDFVIPMGGAVSGLAGGTGGLGANAALWGAGDYRSLGGESSNGNTKWDGDLFGAHFGFDARLRSDLLAGLMVSYSDADIDYEYPNAAGAAQKGDYELDMTSINPYIGWSAMDGQLDIWATLGYGSGDLEITPDGQASLSSDVTMSTFGLGGSSLLRKNGHTGHELRVNAEAFHSRIAADGADRNAAAPDELLELDVDATRLRLMLESRHPRTTATGARLTPSAEIGMRQDSGDGRTGTGAEIGGGIHYNDSSRGLLLEANARALLAHSGDYDDWGISGKIYLQPGADGQGLSLSLTPAYGKTAAATEDIWNNGSLDTDKATNNDDNLQTTLKARIAYGLNLTSGLLTPYTELAWEEKSQTYRLGLQWDITKSLDLKLTGEQKANNNNILLKGEMSF